jgi:aerobic carbon-monoxide dehydrogenase large subunit
LTTTPLSFICSPDRSEVRPISWIGRSLLRYEDPELLTGKGRYIADVVRPGMLDAVFLRSPYPHARIRGIDSSAALAVDGVRAVLTGADLPEDVGPQPCNHLFHGQRETPYFALARERARYVGEPVAIVVAESQYVAEDARELIVVDWEELPSVGNVEVALADGAPRLYDDWPDNVAATYEAEIGDVERAIAEADVVVRERFDIHRLFACPLEGRGAVAEWDATIGELTLWTSTQSPHIVRDYLSWILNLGEHRIRVIVPRVGGGFGAKFHFYPEETAVALAARAVGRPVRWVEDRLESFVGTVHAREQVIEATMAATADGRITAVTAELLGDQGAALHSVSYGPLWLTSVMMTNVYEISNARVRARSIVTNKTPSGSYRGWGQPQANFAVERLVDLVARELELDATEVRRANFVPPDQFPYTGLFHTFDNGRYADCFDKALELLDLPAWRRRQDEARAEGRHIGIGITFYVENTALGPSRKLNAGGVLAGGYDIGHVRMETNGEVIVYSGLCEMGQGFTNGIAQIAADALGVHPDHVTVMVGDTHACPVTGYGTGASRSASVGGASVQKASQKLREKVLAIAGHMLEASIADLEAEEGQVWVRGSRDRYVTMADVGRAAYLRPIELPDGMDPGLEAIEVHDPEWMAWPYGVNAAVVEVDVETGEIRFLDYVYVHDCGTILNPMIVEGQIHGGVAQGIGMALYEELQYDREGYPLTGTFMDYLVPTAAEVPTLRLGHDVTPSPVVPTGAKGIGEAGAIGSPSAIAAAVEDALRPFGACITELPITPEKILSWVRQRESELVA